MRSGLPRRAQPCDFDIYVRQPFGLCWGALLPPPLLLTSSDAQGTDGLTEQATPIYPTPDKQGTGDRG